MEPSAPTPVGDEEIEAPEELAARLRLVIMRLARRLRQQADRDVTQSQLSALATINNYGPLTLKDLAAHERVQPPTMTRIVAALEEMGFIHREVDPTDRRVARVRVSPDGRRYIERSRT